MPNASEVREFSQYVSEAAQTAWTATWEGVDYKAMTEQQRLEKAADALSQAYEDAAKKAGEYWQFADQQGNLDAKKFWKEKSSLLGQRGVSSTTRLETWTCWQSSHDRGFRVRCGPLGGRSLSSRTSCAIVIREDECLFHERKA